MSDDFVIQTKGLYKTFVSKVKGKKTQIEAVKSVNLAVKKGEIFGFLGPNGAGKSTTQKMLCTLLVPTGGQAEVLGYELIKGQLDIRRNIGYVSQAGGTDLYVTGLENLILQAQLYGLNASTAKNNAHEFVERFQMGSFIDRVAGSYSGGQRRRLDVSLGMVHHPQLLLLDEPTTGLDPQSRAYMWDEIVKLKASGITIFLTTHYMDEADKLCDEIAIIDDGTIVARGTPKQLKSEIGADAIVFGFADAGITANAEHLLKGKIAARKMQVVGNSLHLFVKEGEKMVPDILRLLDASGMHALTMALSNPSLDDVFLKYTGRSLREDKS